MCFCTAHFSKDGSSGALCRPWDGKAYEYKLVSYVGENNYFMFGLWAFSSPYLQLLMLTNKKQGKKCIKRMACYLVYICCYSEQITVRTTEESIQLNSDKTGDGTQTNLNILSPYLTCNLCNVQSVAARLTTIICLLLLVLLARKLAEFC